MSSSSSRSWRASPQDPPAGLLTLSRASPGTIYPFRDSPFALDYLPRFRDSLELQVICRFRDNPTTHLFMLCPLTRSTSGRTQPSYSTNVDGGKHFPLFPLLDFTIHVVMHQTCISISYHSNKNSSSLIFKYRHLVFEFYVTEALYSNIYSNMAFHI